MYMLNTEGRYGNILSAFATTQHSNILKEKGAYMEPMSQKNETYTVIPDIEEERGRLRNENMGMVSDLNLFLKRKERLVLKKEYINYKYNEFGDSDRINELFKSWSAEYRNAKREAETLKAEYAKKGGDEKTIPRVIRDVEDDIAILRKAILVARNEIDRVIEAYPDLEGLAKDNPDRPPFQDRRWRILQNHLPRQKVYLCLNIRCSSYFNDFN